VTTAQPAHPGDELTLADIERLERLERAATPGQWEWDNKKGPDDWEREHGMILPYVPQCSHLGHTLIALDDTYENSREDCALLEELRNNAKALLRLARLGLAAEAEVTATELDGWARAIYEAQAMREETAWRALDVLVGGAWREVARAALEAMGRKVP
jgi:hypothetical protein